MKANVESLFEKLKANVTPPCQCLMAMCEQSFTSYEVQYINNYVIKRKSEEKHPASSTWASDCTTFDKSHIFEQDLGQTISVELFTSSVAAVL